MNTAPIQRFLPSMTVIAEEFDALGWQYAPDFQENGDCFCGVRLFSGQDRLNGDCVYIVRPEYTSIFPYDQYAYLCMTPLSGKADHICCTNRSPEELLERVLELFQRYQEWERQLDGLVLSGADLNELCQWGRALLGNPVVIHDAWFIVLAMSGGLPQDIQFETVAESARTYVPHHYIDSFRNDADYTQTRREKKAGLWESKDRPERCIYSNLWDNGEYQGRLLVLEEAQELRPSHFRVVECLAQRAMLILQRGRVDGKWGYYSLDDIVYAFLTGQTPDVTDAAILLNTLQWKRSDQYQCIRLQGQGPGTEAAHRQMIHSDLFRSFPGGYIMFIQHQQCVVLNLDRTPYSCDDICQRLGGLCENYFLYAGLSSPMTSIDELGHAFRQADIALGTAYHRQDDQRVIPFSSCALDYILRSIQTDLPPRHLAAPELLTLLDYDRKNGISYFLTLRNYLVNERSMPQSSQAMIIHRTTLIYRLKKIQAITGLDLEDPDQRLYLLLSFRILDAEER